MASTVAAATSEFRQICASGNDNLFHNNLDSLIFWCLPEAVMTSDAETFIFKIQCAKDETSKREASVYCNYVQQSGTAKE